MINAPKRIRIEMIKKDITGAEIARNAGVHRTAIYKVIDGSSKSGSLRKAIADALGMGVEELWEKDSSPAISQGKRGRQTIPCIPRKQSLQKDGVGS